MPETKVARPGTEPDRRAVVLVVIGLLICLPGAWPRLFPPAPAAGPRPALLWLEGPSSGASALFLLQEGARDSPLANLAVTDTPLTAYRLRNDGPPQPMTAPADLAPLFSLPIAINEATTETLTTIPGIGPRLAAAIIDFRQRTGRIPGPAALRQINGIGEKKAAALARHLRFD